MANGYVHVACKLPQGIRLRLYEWHEENENTPGGPRTIKVSRPVTKDGKILEYVVAGYNPGKITAADMYIVRPGYKTTRVPADFWAKWLAANKDSALVENRIVFAASTEPDLQAMIKEAESGNAVSGLEPISRDGDPRIATLGPMKVTTADVVPMR